MFVSVEKPPAPSLPPPPLNLRPPSRRSTNWQTPKHLGPLRMHWPLLLYNQTQKLVLLVLRLGLNVESQATVIFFFLLLNLHATVVHISSLNSAELLILLSFPLMFDQSVSFSGQSSNSRGEPLPPPKDCLCLHSGLHSYLCAKMSKSVNYDINVHCSNRNPPDSVCFIYFTPPTVMRRYMRHFY